MFSDYMAFLVVSGLHPDQVNVHLLLAFLEYLHQNNCTVSSNGDIVFGQDLAIIVVKCSKTNQFRDKVAKISIPVLAGSPLCPVTALRLLLAAVPGTQTDPLFTIPKQGTVIPLTNSMVRKHFKSIINILHWQHFKFTFHSFRRSGASWAYQHGVPIDAIKQQGL